MALIKLTEAIERDDREFRRGEIFYIDLEDIGYGSRFIQQKTRPALIIQNNIGNMRGETVIVALLTSSIKKPYPFQYKIALNNRESTIMFEQIMTVDKSRILERCGELSPQQMKEAEERLMYSLQLNRLSLENVVDIQMLSLVTKKSRVGEAVYFEMEIQFENAQSTLVQLPLETLQQFDNTINKEMGFDELKKILNCCRGLNWLVKNNAIK